MREAILDVARDRVHAHVLRDINNHEETSLEQVSHLLDRAGTGLEARGRL